MNQAERRQYFRIHAFARVGLRKLAPEEYECVRRRVRMHYRPAALRSGAAEESGISAERRLELDLLRLIALTLERIDRRMDDALIARTDPDARPRMCPPVEIALSGSGFAGCFDVDVDIEPGDCVEVELDLWESGLPRIRAIASAVAPVDGGPEVMAFRFEELHPEDEERIVRLTIKSQSETLREERAGESR